MSIQFGRWNFDGQPVSRDYLRKVQTMIAPYGPDDATNYSAKGLEFSYAAFHTTKESCRETQPHISRSGVVLMWDGRLDNRTELIRELGHPLSCESTDVEIVAGAFARWERSSLARFLGDWAISLWDPKEHTLLLAKDFAGVRHLYYAFEETNVSWSTLLDPLVLLASGRVTLEEEYVAGWLSSLPAAHLTPYAGIRSVPPASYVLVRNGAATIHDYWNFDPRKQIRYKTDQDYEVRFRSLFDQSVRRRLRSHAPILAELSGGMDSSSIVCTAHLALTGGLTVGERLDTISYFDDAEPNWNERPYFTLVEEYRGRAGMHIDLGPTAALAWSLEATAFMASPDLRLSAHGFEQFSKHLIDHGHRVVLSGIGGDEVTGGVPSPTAELGDLLAAAQFRTLLRQLILWAVNKRTPLLLLLGEVLGEFLPPRVAATSRHKRPPPWISKKILMRQQAALQGYPERIRMSRGRPSFQENLLTLDVLRRQLGCIALSSRPPFETRFPFLDRDLLEFLYAIPREQLVRPGERRSLLRRALRGIVPEGIMRRTRKASVTRAPLMAIATQWEALSAMSRDMLVAGYGIIDPAIFCKVIEQVRDGREIPLVPLARTILLERWLRGLQIANFTLTPSSSCERSAPAEHAEAPMTGHPFLS